MSPVLRQFIPKEDVITNSKDNRIEQKAIYILHDVSDDLGSRHDSHVTTVPDPTDRYNWRESNNSLADDSCVCVYVCVCVWQWPSSPRYVNRFSPNGSRMKNIFMPERIFAEDLGLTRQVVHDIWISH